MEAEIFKNCSGFTDVEITEVANLRCGLASFSCIVLYEVFGLLVILAVPNKSNTVERPKVCDKVEKRLLVGLIAVSALYELFLALGVVNYFNPGTTTAEVFCIVDGFLNQYLGSVQLLFTLGIIFIIFFKAICKSDNTQEEVQGCCEVLRKCCRRKCCCGGCCCGVKIGEVVFVPVVFIVCLINLIPFIKDYYGPAGPWCWIRSIEEKCTENTAGLVEQTVLWTVPFGLVALVILALFIALCWLCYASCKLGISKGMDSLPSLAISLIFLFFTVVMYTLEVAMRSYSFYHNDLVTWKAYAVSAPLGQLAIPLALLVAIYLPLSCEHSKCCKRKSQSQIQEGEGEVTYPLSSFEYVPSETNWEPLHSNTASEATPLVEN